MKLLAASVPRARKGAPLDMGWWARFKRSMGAKLMASGRRKSFFS
jgi:hypothetical protein